MPRFIPDEPKPTVVRPRTIQDILIDAHGRELNRRGSTAAEYGFNQFVDEYARDLEERGMEAEARAIRDTRAQKQAGGLQEAHQARLLAEVNAEGGGRSMLDTGLEKLNPFDGGLGGMEQRSTQQMIEEDTGTSWLQDAARATMAGGDVFGKNAGDFLAGIGEVLVNPVTSRLGLGDVAVNPYTTLQAGLIEAQKRTPGGFISVTPGLSGEEIRNLLLRSTDDQGRLTWANPGETGQEIAERGLQSMEEAAYAQGVKPFVYDLARTVGAVAAYKSMGGILGKGGDVLKVVPGARYGTAILGRALQNPAVNFAAMTYLMSEGEIGTEEKLGRMDRAAKLRDEQLVHVANAALAGAALAPLGYLGRWVERGLLTVLKNPAAARIEGQTINQLPGIFQRMVAGGAHRAGKAVEFSGLAWVPEVYRFDENGDSQLSPWATTIFNPKKIQEQIEGKNDDWIDAAAEIAVRAAEHAPSSALAGFITGGPGGGRVGARPKGSEVLSPLRLGPREIQGKVFGKTQADLEHKARQEVMVKTLRQFTPEQRRQMKAVIAADFQNLTEKPEAIAALVGYVQAAAEYQTALLKRRGYLPRNMQTFSSQLSGLLTETLGPEITSGPVKTNKPGTGVEVEWLPDGAQPGQPGRAAEVIEAIQSHPPALSSMADPRRRVLTLLRVRWEDGTEGLVQASQVRVMNGTQPEKAMVPAESGERPGGVRSPEATGRDSTLGIVQNQAGERAVLKRVFQAPGGQMVEVELPNGETRTFPAEGWTPVLEHALPARTERTNGALERPAGPRRPLLPAGPSRKPAEAPKAAPEPSAKAEPPAAEPAAPPQETPAEPARRASDKGPAIRGRRQSDLEEQPGDSEEVKRLKRRARRALGLATGYKSQAQEDTMTGLKSRRLIEKNRKRVDEDPENGWVEADMVGLSTVNAEKGEAFADRVIQEGARVFRKLAEEVGMQTGRRGGDELIAWEGTAEQRRQLQEKMEAADIEVDGQVFKFRAGEAGTWNELVDAMKSAKERVPSGRPAAEPEPAAPEAPKAEPQKEPEAPSSERSKEDELHQGIIQARRDLEEAQKAQATFVNRTRRETGIDLERINVIDEDAGGTGATPEMTSRFRELQDRSLEAARRRDSLLEQLYRLQGGGKLEAQPGKTEKPRTPPRFVGKTPKPKVEPKAEEREDADAPEAKIAPPEKQGEYRHRFEPPKEELTVDLDPSNPRAVNYLAAELTSGVKWKSLKHKSPGLDELSKILQAKADMGEGYAQERLQGVLEAWAARRVRKGAETSTVETILERMRSRNRSMAWGKIVEQLSDRVLTEAFFERAMDKPFPYGSTHPEKGYGTRLRDTLWQEMRKRKLSTIPPRDPNTFAESPQFGKTGDYEEWRVVKAGKKWEIHRRKIGSDDLEWSVQGLPVRGSKAAEHRTEWDSKEEALDAAARYMSGYGRKPFKDNARTEPGFHDRITRVEKETVELADAAAAEAAQAKLEREQKKAADAERVSLTNKEALRRWKLLGPKKKQIELSVGKEGGGKDTQLWPAEVVGPWAVHRSREGSGFTVTHVPTGLIAGTTKKANFARELALRLNATWGGWDRVKDPGKVPADAMKAAMEARDAVRAAERGEYRPLENFEPGVQEASKLEAKGGELTLDAAHVASQENLPSLATTIGGSAPHYTNPGVTFGPKGEGGADLKDYDTSKPGGYSLTGGFSAGSETGASTQKLGVWLKAFASANPSFRADPVFKVLKDGRLEWKGDGATYKIHPNLFGLGSMPKGTERVRLGEDVFPALKVKKGKGTKGLPLFIDPVDLTAKGMVEITPDDFDVGVPGDALRRGELSPDQRVLADAVPDPLTWRKAIGGFSLPLSDVQADFIGEPIGRSPIIRRIAELFDVPIYLGRARGLNTKYLGFYSPGKDYIRLGRAGDLPTTAHEAGHKMEETFYPIIRSAKEYPEIQKELKIAGLKLYGVPEPHNGYESEGMAEFFRVYLTRPELLQQHFPKTLAWMESHVHQTNPKWLRRLEKVRGLVSQWKDQGPTNRILGEVQKLSKVPTGWKKMAGIISKANWIDELDPLYKLMQAHGKLGNPKIAPEDDPLLFADVRRNSANSIAHYMAERGMRDLAGNRTGDPLAKAKQLTRQYGKAAGIGESTAEGMLTAYLIAKRARWLWRTGKGPTNIERRDAKEVVEDTENNHPELVKAAQMVWKWNKGVLAYAYEAGAISSADYQKLLAKSKFYIPFQRIVENAVEGGKGPVTGQTAKTPFRRIKLSGRELRDPWPTMVSQAANVIRFAHRRAVLQRLALLADTSKGLGRFIHKVDRDVVQRIAPMDQVRKWLEENGISPGSIDFDKADPLTYYEPKMIPDQKDPIFPIVGKDGKTRWYQVNQEIYKALNGMDVYRMPQGLDLILGVPARMKRLGTTGLRASFAWVTNPIRDLFTGLIQSDEPNKLKWFHAWLKSMPESIRNGPYKELFDRLGGPMAQPLGIDMRHTWRLGEHLGRSAFGRIKSDLSKGRLLQAGGEVTDAFRNLLQVPESWPRVAELMRMAQKVGWKPGDTLTLRQSLLMHQAAKRVTVDFSAGGRYARAMNAAIPFFNVAFQGPRSFLRAWKKHPVATTIMGAGIAALTWKLWDQIKDEEWYKDLPWRDKFSYWHIPVGENERIRIPRPFEPGILFASIPEAIFDTIHRDQPEALRQVFDHSMNQLRPDLAPVLWQEYTEQLANQDDWSKRPIVPKAEEDMPRAEQIGPTTSGLAKWLGQGLDLSPRRIDHAIQGIFGGVGRDVASSLTGPGLVSGDLETEPADIPVFGKLFARGGKTGVQSQAVTDVFSMRSELLRRRASESDPITSAEKSALRLLERASKRIRELRKERDALKGRAERDEVFRRMRREAMEAVEKARAILEDEGASSSSSLPSGTGRRLLPAR